MAAYATDFLDSRPLARSLTDFSVPESGGGFYYVVRPDCPVGSWQTAVGAEPGRDAARP